MNLPQKKLKPIGNRRRRLSKSGELVKSSTSASEFAAYRERLSGASHGIVAILDRLETEQSDLKRKLGAVKLLLGDLGRHEDLAKDRFWAIMRP